MKNADGLYLDINSKEAYQRFEKWLPVDLYIGGQEHAVGHLIYSRFWHKFLYDIKILPVDEPFLKVVNQGMILEYLMDKKCPKAVVMLLIQMKLLMNMVQIH
nr:hypothetical protein [Mycoplasmopsis cynos]